MVLLVRQIVGSGIPNETMARTSDGLSNTIVFWESIGGVIIPSGTSGIELEVDGSASPSFELRVYGPPNIKYRSKGVAATKSYIHCWAGLRLGNIREAGGRVVNVGNSFGEPCSRHPGGASSVLLDGSVRLLSRDLAAQVAFALASVRGHEVVGD